MYGIVGVVVDSGHGAELVETFNQHTFRIEIGESERSGNVSHAPFLSPVFYCFDESGGYFRVVNEVYPPETDVLATPFLVGTVVDNSGYFGTGTGGCCKHLPLRLYTLRFRCQNLHLVATL